ncbi:MAG: hydrogenase maturation protease [Candidatus Latescibacteria bacterium]|nr:hydrogenase maturation protease [bacterium]MBD3423520.1 hydrogenase maturation protease [Candidatus Latescibacterota bacterium]
MKEELIRRLKGKRFGVVGIGNVIRGDDGAGCRVAELLEGRLELPVVDAAEVPENYGGWVARRQLEAVVYVDAVEFDGRPGEARIIPLENLMMSASSTHSLSLHYMIKYLEDEWEGDPILVGIKPRSMNLNDPLSPEVEEGARKVAEAIIGAANEK